MGGGGGSRVPVELKIRNGALVWESDGRGVGEGVKLQ